MSRGHVIDDMKYIDLVCKEMKHTVWILVSDIPSRFHFLLLEKS